MKPGYYIVTIFGDWEMEMVVTEDNHIYYCSGINEPFWCEDISYLYKYVVVVDWIEEEIFGINPNDVYNCSPEEWQRIQEKNYEETCCICFGSRSRSCSAHD